MWSVVYSGSNGRIVLVGNPHAVGDKCVVCDDFVPANDHYLEIKSTTTGSAYCCASCTPTLLDGVQTLASDETAPNVVHVETVAERGPIHPSSCIHCDDSIVEQSVLLFDSIATHDFAVCHEECWASVASDIEAGIAEEAGELLPEFL